MDGIGAQRLGDGLRFPAQQSDEAFDREPVTRSAIEAIDRAACGREPRMRSGTATAHDPLAKSPGLWTKPSMRA